MRSYHEFTGKKEVQYVRCFLGGYRRPKEWRRLQDGRKTIGIKAMSVYPRDKKRTSIQGTHKVCKRYREEKKCKGSGEEQSIRKRFIVEKCMQGLRIRAEKSNVAEHNECTTRATEEKRVRQLSKTEQSMQSLKSRTGNAGIQRRAEHARIIEKNRVS